MSKLGEKAKDFLYDSVDYILILVVVLIVGGVVGWRLDILFAKDIDKPQASIETNNPSEDSNDIANTQGENEDEIDLSDSPESIVDTSETDPQNNTDKEETPAEDTSTPKEPETPQVSEPEIVSIDIPSGALGPKIAEILLQHNLINSEKEFLAKAKELELDTKLRSGKYEIDRNSSLENIIKIIAGKN
ncbi:hypothetical protein [Clostridiisalibacter paucivorans]|uniref:hypothetical protein n=1 Tax=Clostridiisalibacter paucivorans TaxID=408753 RepID=UPI00047EB4C1|nr:hypothetical protein [Clostridiisalibacter paucivorans]